MVDPPQHPVDAWQKVAPFEAVRGAPEGLAVKAQGRWYRLVSVEGIGVRELTAAAKRLYLSRWLKRVGEDLPRLFADMGAVLLTPTKVTVFDNGAEHTLWLDCSEGNRRSVLAYNRRNHGPGRVGERREVDHLLTLLRERHAYWPLVEEPERALAPLRDAVDAIECPVDYELALATSLGRLGDGHTRTARSLPRLLAEWAHQHRRVPELLPCSAVPVEGRWAAVDHRSRLLDPDHPFLAALDDVPIERWVAAIEEIVPRVSPQLVRAMVGELLPFLHWSRSRLDVPSRPYVDVNLADARGSERHVRLDVAASPPRSGAPERRASALDGNIGYLPISSTSGSAPAVVGALAALRHTKALILDLRGNRGGSRDLVWSLVPFFLDHGRGPQVFNVAAKRLVDGERREDENLLADRGLFRLRSNRHDADARSAIQRLDFVPDMTLPEAEYSDWRYGVVSPAGAPWHYDRPVAVLTDEWCFSAGEILATALCLGPNVIHVGTPTGGGSGRPVPLMLPSSEIEIRVSSMASFQPDGSLYERRGLHPATRIERTVGDCDGAGDAVEAARRYLEEVS